MDIILDEFFFTIILCILKLGLFLYSMPVTCSVTWLVTLFTVLLKCQGQYRFLLFFFVGEKKVVYFSNVIYLPATLSLEHIFSTRLKRWIAIELDRERVSNQRAEAESDLALPSCTFKSAYSYIL